MRRDSNVRQRFPAIANSQGKNSPLPIPLHQAPQGPHERFLRHVFGILTMPQHAVTQAEHGPLMAIHQVHDRGLLARQAAVDQVTEFVGQFGLLAEDCVRFRVSERYYPCGRAKVSDAASATSLSETEFKRRRAKSKGFTAPVASRAERGNGGAAAWGHCGHDDQLVIEWPKVDD